MVKSIFLIVVLSLKLLAMSVEELQTADEKRLSCIKGIGEMRLNAILKYREKHKIENLSDLINIPKIGEKIIFNIKNDVKKKSCQVNKKTQMQNRPQKGKKKIGAE